MTCAWKSSGASPRRARSAGWVVTVAHLGFLPAERAAEAVGSDDAAEAAWLRLVIDRGGAHRLEHAGAPVTRLAFDHLEVVALAVRRLRERVAELGFALIPRPFSLEQAQRAFEAILGAPLDPAALLAELLREGLVREAPAEEGATSPRYHAAPLRLDLRLLSAAEKK